MKAFPLFLAIYGAGLLILALIFFAIGPDDDDDGGPDYTPGVPPSSSPALEPEVAALLRARELAQ